MRRPPGAFYALTRRRLQVARALAEALNAKLILGVQFEADNRLEAARESRAMMTVIGRRRIAGLELGNEPERYGWAAWYQRDGIKHPGRPPSWSFNSFLRDFSRIANAMGNVPLAGPTFGVMAWLNDLGRFLAAEPKVALVTVHRYPLEACGSVPGETSYPTIPNLLLPQSSIGLALDLMSSVQAAHAQGLQLRNATLGADGRVRVVLINDDTAHPQSMTLSVANAGGSVAIERLQAPGAAALGGVKLGGRGFPAVTTTGRLPGPARQATVPLTGGAYSVTLPKASAALLTVDVAPQ